MTQARYEEIKATLTDKKWNAAEFAMKAEKLLPELFAGIDKGSFEEEPVPAAVTTIDPKHVFEIEGVPAEEIETKIGPVGEPLPEIQAEPMADEPAPEVGTEAPVSPESDDEE